MVNRARRLISGLLEEARWHGIVAEKYNGWCGGIGGKGL